MCGRYSLFTDEDYKEIRKIIQEVSDKHYGKEIKTGEIFPTNAAPILKEGQGKILPTLSIWGFPNYVRKSGVIINARSETAQDKKMFRDSLLFRRCVIPSTGFYEWSQDGTHQKYLFTLPGEKVLYMAGFYNRFQGEERYVILTANANESVREIHNRMPVVLRPSDIRNWIGDRKYALDYLTKPLPILEKAAV